MLEESAAILEDLGERCILTSVLTSLGSFDMRSGAYAAARARLERGLAIAREIGHPLEMAGALTNLGCLHRILGEYSTAQSCFERGPAGVSKRMGVACGRSEVLCYLAEHAISQGDLTAARSHLQAASDRLGTSENKWLQALACYFRGLLAHYEGDAAAAMTLLE